MQRFVHLFARVLLVLVSLGSGPQWGFGGTIFDNLAAPTNGGVGFGSTSDLRAQQFQTTATEYILDSVTVRLDNPSSGTGNYSLSVYTSASNNPGSLAGVFGSGSWTSIGGPYQNTTMNGLLTLSPSTLYFMVMSVDGTSNGQWGATTTNPGFVESSSTNGGTSWSATGQYAQMRVTAVPEPGMWTTLAVGGLAAWGGLRRRGLRSLE